MNRKGAIPNLLVLGLLAAAIFFGLPMLRSFSLGGAQSVIGGPDPRVDTSQANLEPPACEAVDSTVTIDPAQVRDAYNAQTIPDVIFQPYVDGKAQALVNNIDGGGTTTAACGAKFVADFYDDGTTNADGSNDWWWTRVDYGFVPATDKFPLSATIPKEGTVNLTARNDISSTTGTTTVEFNADSNSAEQDAAANETVNMLVNLKEATSRAFYPNPQTPSVVLCADQNTVGVTSLNFGTGAKTVGNPSTHTINSAVASTGRTTCQRVDFEKALGSYEQIDVPMNVVAAVAWGSEGQDDIFLTVYDFSQFVDRTGALVSAVETDADPPAASGAANDTLTVRISDTD